MRGAVRPGAARPEGPPARRSTVAHLLVALLTLGVVASLPFALVSLVEDLRGSHEWLDFAQDGSAGGEADFRLHLDITSIDPHDGGVNMRVLAARGCAESCPDEARVDLLATLDGAGEQPLPVIETLDFRPGGPPVSKVVWLPVSGEAIRYPFDAWTLDLRVVPVRTAAAQAGGAADAAPRVTLTAQNRAARLTALRQPAREERAGGAATPGEIRASLRFERPLYLRIVTVLLVVLVAAAAAYAVFLRPLSELIINAGALVLGVWGVRAVLLGTDLTIVTGVDLALMGVILFLLGMITVRTLWGLEGRSRLRPMRGAARRWRRIP